LYSDRNQIPVTGTTVKTVGLIIKPVILLPGQIIKEKGSNHICGFAPFCFNTFSDFPYA
jgi:hypothetical protein